MASYSQPSDKYNGIYNPDYFIGKEDELKLSAVSNAVNTTGDYVKRDGSNIMTGTLTTPGLILFNDGSIYFDDTTHQHTAFTDSHKADVIANTQKLTSLSYSSTDDSTIIMGALKIKKIIFLDDSNSEQSFAFSSAMVTDINSSKQKTTGTTYNASNLKTTIDLLHATTFTTDSFNVSHMANTTSNVQLQINNLPSEARVNALETKTTDITRSSGITSIANLSAPIFTTESFDVSHVTGTTSNIQTQINNLPSEVRVSSLETKTTDIAYINSVTTITNLSAPIFMTESFDVSHMANTTSNIQTQIDSIASQTSTTNPDTKVTDFHAIRLFNDAFAPVFLGNIEYSDGTFQTTAFNSEKIISLNSVVSKTANFEGMGTYTIFHGPLNCENNIYLEDGVRIAFYGQNGDQYYAYTNTDRAKLQGISMTNSKINNSSLTDGAKLDKMTLNTYNTLSITDLEITTLYFPDNVQTIAFSNAWRDIIVSNSVGVSDNSKSSITEVNSALGLFSTGSSFYTNSKQVYLFSLPAGINFIEGVIEVLNINSLTKMLAYVFVPGISQSPQVGIDFQSSDTTYYNFRQPIFWTVKLSTPQPFYIDLNYSYRPNSGMTSNFNFRVTQLK